MTLLKCHEQFVDNGIADDRLERVQKECSFGIFKRSKLKSEIRKLKKPSVGHKNKV